MAENGPKLDTSPSLKEGSEALVRDGLQSIQFWLKHFEACNSIKELEDWQSTMNALVATTCSHKKMLRSIIFNQSYLYPGGIHGMDLFPVSFAKGKV